MKMCNSVISAKQLWGTKFLQQFYVKCVPWKLDQFTNGTGISSTTSVVYAAIGTMDQYTLIGQPVNILTNQLCSTWAARATIVTYQDLCVGSTMVYIFVSAINCCIVANVYFYVLGNSTLDRKQNKDVDKCWL